MVPVRFDQYFQFYAITHGRPLVNGALSRTSDMKLAELAAIPPFRQILAMEHEPGFADPASFTPADLRRLGFAFVVYHRDRPVPAALAYLMGLGLPVLTDDGKVVVWKLP
jgi:hypothetical protein